MGKRKERRLAHLMAAGRRVKVDIMEPSGDFVGSSAKDRLVGVELDTDPRHLAGSPNSPSSPGKLENPLLLLGQYSDEDSDEELGKESAGTTVEKSLVDDGQDNGSLYKKSEDVEVTAYLGNDTSKDLEKRLEGDSKVADPVQNQYDNDEIEIDDTTSFCEKVVSENEATISASSDVRHTTDVTSSWKMVLHEESNQYYYWNTLTGETSWVVPSELSYQTELMVDKEIVINAEGRLDPITCSHEANADLDSRLAAYASIDSNNHLKDTNASLGIQDISEDVVTAEGEQNGNIGEMDDEKGHKSDVKLTEISNSSKEETASDTEYGHTPLGSNTDSERMMVKEDEDDDLGHFLVNLGESLLKRLTSLKSSTSHGVEHAWISKNMLEVEVRLHDIKSLLPFGSSLLPFWVHCERCLKQLEDDIDKHDQKLEQIFDTETTPLHDERVGCQIVADRNQSAVVGLTPEASLTINDGTRKAIVEEQGACHGAEEPTESIHKVSYVAGEDVDMDVDMEVDEVPMHSNSYANDISLPGSFGAPPDEDWVPPPPPPPEDELIPPPPDNETFPPPPSDNATEPSYVLPASYPGTTYTDQYNMSYLTSNYDYYGQTSREFLQNGLYVQTEGGQVAVPHASLYYDALPSVYPVAPVVVNPIPHVTYYDHQEGSAYPIPISSSQDAIISDQIKPVKVTINEDVGKVFKEVPSVPVSVQVPTAMPVVESVASAAVSSTSTVAKKQKALRVKKKTTAVVTSLRSNKKVSSLVDKWKAAKEELLEKEEEEDPLSAYELLEKKRQREIEEWHAQQIASGEAKVNANFQPLGGDWRERVKRKRARMNSEPVEESPPSEGQQKPDLDQISKALPSGWLAYWDESTKKVYYANARKSETTWTKPTS